MEQRDPADFSRFSSVFSICICIAQTGFVQSEKIRGDFKVLRKVRENQGKFSKVLKILCFPNKIREILHLFYICISIGTTTDLHGT